MKKPPPPSGWEDLRDDRGHLYGRVNRAQMLLHIRLSHERVAYFDLRPYVGKAYQTGTGANKSKKGEDE